MLQRLLQFLSHFDGQDSRLYERTPGNQSTLQCTGTDCSWFHVVHCTSEYCVRAIKNFAWWANWGLELDAPLLIGPLEKSTRQVWYKVTKWTAGSQYHRKSFALENLLNSGHINCVENHVRAASPEAKLSQVGNGYSTLNAFCKFKPRSTAL